MRGLLGAMFAERKLDERVGSVEEMWRDLYGGRISRSGISVSWEKALQVTTALRCAAIIAEAICSIPFKVYRRVEQGNQVVRAEARDHPLFDLLTTAPNDWQTSFEFRETIGLHLALCGNAYVFKNRVRGALRELIPFEPKDVTVIRERDWSVRYRVIGRDGSQQEFTQEAIWHLRGRSWNSYMGLETIALAREALGLALATEESHARMHDRAVRPSGLVTIDAQLTDAQFTRWRNWIDAYYSGPENVGKALILDRAAKWQSLQLTGVDAQHLQTRGFQIEEVCRAMGVLPIMVGYTGDKNATFASSEQMFLAHHQHTARPWHRRIEASTDRWCLTQEERRAGFYTGFVDTELLRGDHKARAEYNKISLGGGGNPGWRTPNEVRGDEELPPYLGGDHLYVPAALGPMNADGVPTLPARPVAGAADPAPEA